MTLQPHSIIIMTNTVADTTTGVIIYAIAVLGVLVGVLIVVFINNAIQGRRDSERKKVKVDDQQGRSEPGKGTSLSKAL